MSPLPRIDEIDKEIDVDSSAQYFENSDDAAFIRTSLMERGFDLEGREP
ncbi:MAG: hypothetical protein IPF98_22750 [Gemmatimonadetes bacterium]|nr:hypothetical protein [Gemmatimonadota bacterium]